VKSLWKMRRKVSNKQIIKKILRSEQRQKDMNWLIHLERSLL
jgi:hypothetical protein